MPSTPPPTDYSMPIQTSSIHDLELTQFHPVTDSEFLKARTHKDWMNVCHDLQADKLNSVHSEEYYQKGVLCQRILLKALELNCSTLVLTQLLDIGIIPQAVHLVETFRTGNNDHLGALLGKNSLLQDENNTGLLLALKAMNWGSITTYLMLRTPNASIKTELLLNAVCIAKDFLLIATLIEVHKAEPTPAPVISTVIDTAYDILDCLNPDTKAQWREAVIIANDCSNVKIHYSGLHDKYDEWIDIKKSGHRFAKHRTLSCEKSHMTKQSENWQIAFQSLFLSAKASYDWTFIDKYLERYIDLNDRLFLSKLLEHLQSFINHIDSSNEEKNERPVIIPKNFDVLLKKLETLLISANAKKSSLMDIPRELTPSIVLESNSEEGILLMRACLKAAVYGNWTNVNGYLKNLKVSDSNLFDLITLAVRFKNLPQVEMLLTNLREDSNHEKLMLNAANVGGDFWNIVNSILKTKPVSQSTLVLLTNLALKQQDLKQFIKLQKQNVTLDSLNLFETFLNDAELEQLAEDQDCDFLIEPMQWVEAKILYRNEKLVYVTTAESDPEWLDLNFSAQRFARLNTFSKPSLPTPFAKKQCLMTMFWKAESAEEWRAVCQFLATPTLEGQFSYSFWNRLFYHALFTKADADTITFLLKSTVIVTSHILEAIRQGNLSWLPSINKSNLKNILYNAANNDKWSIVETCLALGLIDDEMILEIQPIAISAYQFHLVIALYSLGATFDKLALQSPRDFYNTTKQGYEIGESISCVLANSYDVYSQRRLSIVHVEKDRVFASEACQQFYQCWISTCISGQVQGYRQHATIASHQTQDRLENRDAAILTMGQFLEQCFLLAKTHTEWEFVCKHLDQILGLVMEGNRSDFLQRLLSAAIKNNANNDTLVHIISKNFLLLPIHLKLCFTRVTTRQLEVILHEDKDVVCDAALMRVNQGDMLACEHIHLYLENRKPERYQTLSFLIEKFYAIDKSHNNVDIACLVKNSRNFVMQMQQALRYCWENAFNNSDPEYAARSKFALFLDYYMDRKNLEALNHLMLTTKTDQQWLFVEAYLTDKPELDATIMQNMVYLALNNKRYSMALITLKKSVASFATSPDIKDAIAELIKYGEENLKETVSASRNNKKSISALFFKSNPTVETKFILVCKLVVALTDGYSTFSDIERRALNENDLRTLLAKYDQVLPEQFRNPKLKQEVALRFEG